MKRALLLTAALLSSHSFASSAVASSLGLVTVVRSAPQSLASFLESLGRQSGDSVVLLPGIPAVQVSYQFTRLPWSLAWSTTLAAHELAYCRGQGVLLVGPAASLTRACSAASLAVVVPGAPPVAAPVVAPPAVPASVAPVLPVSEPLGAGPSLFRLVASSYRGPDLPADPVVPVAVDSKPALPQRYGVRVRLLEIADNSGVGGGVDWSGSLLGSLLGIAVGAVTGGAAGAFVPSELTSKITALESQGLARKLDDVRLMLTDGKATVFRSGGTLQVSLLGGGEAKVERSLQYGLTLNLTPAVASDGSVSVDVQADLSSPVSVANPALLDLTTRSVTGSVSARPGAGVVLASFTSIRDESEGSGVPGVARVPVVGYLAGRSSASSARTTVVVTLELEARS